MNLGEKIRKFREIKGMSQFDLELEIETSNGRISKIENGVINPDKETIMSIAKALELDNKQIASLFDIELPDLSMFPSADTQIQGIILNGPDEVYRTAERLINKSNSSITSLIHSPVLLPPAPDYWAKSIADRISSTRNPIKFDLTIATYPNITEEEFSQKVAESFLRYYKFGAINLTKQINVYRVNMLTPVGFDMQIVDDRDLILRFHSEYLKNEFQTAMLFENKPEFVSEVLKWLKNLIDNGGTEDRGWLGKFEKLVDPEKTGHIYKT